jgi:hypothetical protein
VLSNAVAIPYISSGGAIATTAGGPTLNFLAININNTIYKIALLNN